MDKNIVVYKTQCPLCAKEGRDNSQDNAHVFESGYANCVAGHGSIGKLDKNGKTKRMTKKNRNDGFPKQGIFHAIKSRGISEETCKFYNYQVVPKTKEHIANYCNAAGEVVMQQIRTPDKQFPMIGNREHRWDLWGMHLFSANEGDNRFVTITEGQIDCLSIAEVFDCKWPVVSLPNGADSAEEVILKNKEWLEGFKYVILAFDSDKPGRDATEKCMKVLEPGKVKICRWKRKDANEHLVAGEADQIKKSVYNAALYVPEPILTGDRLLETLEDWQSRTRDWPFPTMNEVLQPIRTPCIYTIAARPGIGKTEFVGEIMRAEVGSGGKIGVVALEQTMQQILIKLTDTLLGTTLSLVSNRKFTEEEREMCRIVAENLVIYDHITYGSSLDNVVAHIPYMVRALGCEFVIFDNLSYSATAIRGDERRGIDQSMIALKDSTIKYDYTLFNVCHIKREDGFSELEDDDFPVSVNDIRGSQGIEMYSDYIIGLHRDKDSEDPKRRNRTYGQCLKDRMTGQDVGVGFHLDFNPETKRFV